MHLTLLFTLCSFMTAPSFALSDLARSKSFVYLHEIDPTIRQSVRYCSTENFVGDRVDGYKAPVIIMTKQAAEALKAVQADVQKDGYSLVVYDAYRPQRAVNHFMRWSEDVTNQARKESYYPHVNKADVFELGYVDRRSGHSRGSTVDLTLIKLDQELLDVTLRNRTLLNGSIIQIQDDGTIDMGSSFDLFDVVSHYASNLIDEECKAHRTYLKNMMEKHGFKNYSEEWWHFTLKSEPYPSDQDESYFDFEVE